MDTLERYGISADHPGAIALKGLLDNGFDINDNRCQTLIALLSNHTRQKQQPPPVANPPIHLNVSDPASNANGSAIPHKHANNHAQAHRPQYTAQQPIQFAQQQQHHSPVANNNLVRPLPRLPSLSYPDARNTFNHAQNRQPANTAHAAPHPSNANHVPVRTSGVNDVSPPQQSLQYLFGAQPWPQAEQEPQPGVPYFPTSASQQLRHMKPSNVYASLSDHLVQQAGLNHLPNRPFSFEDNQRAIVQRRLLIERQASQTFVTPNSPAVGTVEMRPQPPSTPENSQPMLDPAKYFTDTYASPEDQERASPGNTPNFSNRAIPASGARPPPMPPLKSVAGSTPPKRTRSSKSTPVTDDVHNRSLSEETEQILDAGHVKDLFPSEQQQQPQSLNYDSSSGHPKLDPKLQQVDQPPPPNQSDKPSKRNHGSKSARKTGEDTRMEGDTQNQHTSDAAEAPSSSEPSEDFDVSQAANVFQIPKKLKPKKKRKKKQKAGEVTNPTVTANSTEQRVNGLKIHQVFQAKAQADAFRRISRGMEPPLEVTLASGGVQSLSKSGKKANGVVIPHDLLSEGTYQAESAKRILKPGTSHKPSPVVKKANLSQPPQVEKQNSTGKTSSSSSKDHPLTALFDAPPMKPISAKAAKAKTRKAQAEAKMEEALNKKEEELKHPIPFRSLRHLRNDRLYMYRREVLENFSRNRAHRSLNRRPLPRRTSSTPANGTPQPNGVPASNITSSSTPQPLPVVNPPISKRRYSEAPITVAPSQYNGRQFRELLFERENRISSRIQNRLHELDSLPSDVHEDFRRFVIMEKKKLNLIKLQRAARTDITSTMRALFARGNTVPIGDENLTKYRFPTPRNWHWRHPQAPGVNLANPNATLSDVALRNMQAMNREHRRQQESRRQIRQKAMLNKLLAHSGKVHEFKSKRGIQHKKLLKDLDRYFRDKAKEEERRKRKEQQDRLKALRENNEDEYMKLLKNTKNKRLLQLLRQTDEYLTTIGAKVAQAQQAGRDDEERNRKKNKKGKGKGDEEKYNDEGAENKDADLSAIQQRRNDYYTVTHAVKEKVQQPTTLVGGTLKHYQLEGLEWLVSLYNNNLNGILADEMGLGKTIQTLSLITYLVEIKQVRGPYLIIVPLSTISNWVRELKHWAPSLAHIVYRGTPDVRKNIYHRQIVGGDFNVLLTTYEFIVKDTKNLSKIKWKYIIIDEGHRMKNAECKLALTLGSKYKSRNRILLTGTPLQNNLTELWALLNFLLPTIFSNSETFEQWFNAPFQAACLGGGADLDEEENLLVISRLHQVLRPFMLRRLKTDVECQLPDKVEEVLKCEMSAWQRVMYRQMQDRLGIANSSKGTRAFNNIVMQLKKVANHPYLFYSDEELHRLPRDYLIRTSGKFELLHHVLKKLQHTGHRVLMFSQMTSALDFLETFMYNCGIHYLRLDGTTKADDRQKMLEDFNAPDSKYFCFLLSTRAGGLGLNLQTADTVIIFDSDWNPMMDLQAQDRAHRIGQTKEVRVLRLVCAGTIEEQILERANQKLRMDAQVIQAGQFNNKSSDRDRQEMLKHILRKPAGEDDKATVEATSLEEINRMLARSEEELTIFTEMDTERLAEAKEAGRPPLMVDEDEVPSWVRIPEVEQKSKEETEAEYMLAHGRGQRKRKQVRYSDMLNEQEFTEAVEEEGDLEEAARRKRRRIEDNNNNTHEIEEENNRNNNNNVEEEEEENNNNLAAGTEKRRRNRHKPGRRINLPTINNNDDNDDDDDNNKN